MGIQLDYMKLIKFTKQETTAIEFLINSEQRNILQYHRALIDAKKGYTYKIVLNSILRKIERL